MYVQVQVGLEAAQVSHTVAHRVAAAESLAGDTLLVEGSVVVENLGEAVAGMPVVVQLVGHRSSHRGASRLVRHYATLDVVFSKGKQ